jgi:hypothetical protein
MAGDSAKATKDLGFLFAPMALGLQITTARIMRWAADHAT